MRGYAWVAVLSMLWGAAVSAQDAPRATPEVFELVERDEADGLHIAVVGSFEDLDVRIGGIVSCERESGTLEGGLFFGAFPQAVPVQGAIRGPDGTVERFGPVVMGSPAAGFHSPMVEEREEVMRLMDALFVTGALVSNGYNSVWVRVSQADNEDARERLMVCAQGQQ